MTYDAAVAYLYSLQKHGIKLGLETIETLVARLGFPHRRYRTLHIGGTNGKGSTAAMAAAVLQAAGYRVGLYTSPHLVEFRERIRVNGEMIAESEVARLTDQMKELCEPDLSPTFFEFTTAVAFQYFAEVEVNVAVLEVGLGGRFDATNVVAPLACAITTIALDHQEYLGTTLGSIAFEKAGIIKPNVPVVIGRIAGEARQVIEQAARSRSASLGCLGQDFHVIGERPAQFSYVGREWRLEDLCCPLEGSHQLDNAACALALLEAAGSSGLNISEQAIRDGLSRVMWEGRLEVVDRRPTVVLDGAHNPAAASAVADYLRSFRASNPSSRVILVLGMMRDKNHRGFAAPLKDLVDDVVLTQAELPRSATVEELQTELKDIWPYCRASAILTDALGLAKRLAGPDDLICVTGSLMLIGDLKGLLRGCRLSPLRG